MLNQDERKWLDKAHRNLTFEEQIAKKMANKDCQEIKQFLILLRQHQSRTRSIMTDIRYEEVIHV